MLFHVISCCFMLLKGPYYASPLKQSRFFCGLILIVFSWGTIFSQRLHSWSPQPRGDRGRLKDWEKSVFKISHSCGFSMANTSLEPLWHIQKKGITTSRMGSIFSRQDQCSFLGPRIKLSEILGSSIRRYGWKLGSFCNLHTSLRPCVMKRLRYRVYHYT